MGVEEGARRRAGLRRPRRRVLRADGGRRHQDQGADALRVADGQPGGELAAEGVALKVEALQPQVGRRLRHGAGQVRHRLRAFVRRRVSEARRLEEDDAALPREEVMGAKAHDAAAPVQHHQGRPFARLQVPHPEAVRLHEALAEFGRLVSDPHLGVRHGLLRPR